MCGEGRKTQAGGGVAASAEASAGVEPEAGQAPWPPGEARARKASPGRLKTAIGSAGGDRLPVAPAVETGEIVGAHHPDEVDAGQRAAAGGASVSAV